MKFGGQLIESSAEEIFLISFYFDYTTPSILSNSLFLCFSIYFATDIPTPLGFKQNEHTLQRRFPYLARFARRLSGVESSRSA